MGNRRPTQLNKEIKKSKFSAQLLGLLLMPVLPTSCEYSSTTDGSCPNNALHTGTTSDCMIMTTHSSEFGTNLFTQLASDSSSRNNILFSPLSITQSVALIRDGATSESDNEAELSRLLGPPSLLEKERQLRSQSAEKNDDVRLKIATSLWADGFKSSYVELAKSTHLAEAYPLPISYSSINKWVSEKTDGLIRKIFDESEAVDKLMTGLLVNAVHFKGSWTEKFSANKTVDGDFHLRPIESKAEPNDNEVRNKVPAKFMTATRDMEVIPKSESLGGASVLILDYGKRITFGPEQKIPEFCAMFILPATSDSDSMTSVVQGLSSRPIANLLEETRIVEVKLKLPRFRLNYGPSSVKSALKNMGMRTAFNPTSPDIFHEMSNDPSLYIGDIMHGATMEVTEEGTVAAAVTVTKMRALCVVFKPPPLVLTFDRPFVVVVLHRPSGVPLFIGKVESPEFNFSSSF
eukprot:CAMPEP_0171337374 /NCGR_PEP_ID=MMETSP0878-20121228/6653_1 /TAXON_ID=67004 /ORGANISM="Thalassiosira weissflogii, Strain CCMP1336" /LENGTH=461 /DNA_ID=CAMNT_0011838993 /DNA_START=44 /DNA_END=1429 /DNA_ORIENTATION=-